MNEQQNISSTSPTTSLPPAKYLYQKTFAFSDYSLPGNWEMVVLYFSQQIDISYACTVKASKEAFNSDTLIVFVLSSHSIGDLAGACFKLAQLIQDIKDDIVYQNKGVEVGVAFELIYVKQLRDFDNNVNGR